MDATLRTSVARPFSKPALSHTIRPCSRSVRNLKVSNEATHKDRSAAALGAMELPHGVLWWQDKQHNVYQHDMLHGQDFVLQRQRSGGPGLVLSQRLSSVQIVDKTERKRVQLAMYKSTRQETGIQLAVSDVITFDLKDYSLVEDTDSIDSDDCLEFPPTTCTGIVLRRSGDQSMAQVCAAAWELYKTSHIDLASVSQAGDQVSTSHSRRTKAVSVLTAFSPMLQCLIVFWQEETWTFL